MKMKRALLAAILAMASIAAVSAQDKPDFTGTWRSPDSFTQWTITVEGSRMTVTMTVAGNSDSTVYLLDGTPSIKTMEGPNGMIESVYTSTWEGRVLVTTITTPGPNPMIEKRSIEADGTMKVERIVTIQGQPQAHAQLFKKIGRPGPIGQ